MPSFTLPAFASALVAHFPSASTERFCVAFSGGLDSAVLLHALARLRLENPRWQVRAVYVDHQLQASSASWAAHCKCIADQLGVEFAVERVSVEKDDEHGLEAAARAARYAALRRHLNEGEVLLTAHHADDQAETVLLALMRGSGVPGLSAMPSLREFGTGWHLRPLLSFTRADLEHWAQEQGIDAIHDPTNAMLHHDRNYLRHEILPRLRTRWPAAAAGMGRSAGHLGEALNLLNELARSDLRGAEVDRCLRIDALRKLPVSRCRNLLRYWLRERGLPAPSTRKLAGLMLDLFNTNADRVPCVRWRGAELHWYRNLLYAEAPAELEVALDNYECRWVWGETHRLPETLGSLSMQPTGGRGLSAQRLPPELTVRFRRGGEKIQLPGRQHRSALRNLLQESDVLPWWREKLPLVFDGKRLLAVGDLFLAEEWVAQPGEAALRVAWEGAPAWKAVRADGE